MILVVNMSKTNPKYSTIDKLSEQINQLLTDARAYAKLRDDVDDPYDESLKNRPNYDNLERKIKEVKKLSLKVDKTSRDTIEEQIKEIKDLYWGIEKEVYSDGTSCITVNLGKMHPKAMKAYLEIESRFRKQVSKRIEEGRKEELKAEKRLRNIFLTY